MCHIFENDIKYDACRSIRWQFTIGDNDDGYDNENDNDDNIDNDDDVNDDNDYEDNDDADDEDDLYIIYY